MLMQLHTNLQSLENYKQEFLKKASEVCAEAQTVYFDERIAMLQIVMRLLNAG